MAIGDFIKSNITLIVLIGGLILVSLLDPSQSNIGWLIFVAGVLGGQLIQRFDPPKRAFHGPLIPWDEMGAGERFEYFLQPVGVVVMGGILLVVGSDMMETGLDWTFMLGAAAIVLIGVATATMKWRNRYQEYGE